MTMNDDDLIGDAASGRARLGTRSGGGERGRVGRLALRLAIFLVVAAALYYPVGMLIVHRVDDSPELAYTVGDGESHAVAAAAALIDRETNQHRWTANDPFFLPGAALDNMPNFQQGIIYALSRFAIEMSDQIGRIRGSSQVDQDLDKAAGRLKFPGTIWYFDFGTSLAPTTPSEQQYRAARKDFLNYNKRLAAGDASFERRSDNLQATLERFAADLGSSSAVLDQRIADSSFLIDTKADDVFYQTKGRLYGYYILLTALGEDFKKLIAERELTNAWAQMLDSFRTAATMDPLIVINGAPDSLIMPSHLAAQGFYLLRSRTQLKEISNILLK
jgi:hypothetical protein